MQKRVEHILGIALLAGLVLWGGYVTLTYIGVPIHGSVLFPGGMNPDPAAHCGQEAYICRGLATAWPSLRYSITRWFVTDASTATPFAWFILVSALLYAGIFGWSLFRKGQSSIRITLSPLRILALFVALLWLLFTCFSLGNQGEVPYRQVYEPSPQMYINAGTEALDALKENFNRLEQRGCLKQLGTTDRGIRVFNMRGWCMQGFFFSRVFLQLALVLFLTITMAVFGRSLLSLMRAPPFRRSVDAFLSILLGACAIIALLWTLAAVHLFTFWMGWLLLLGINVVCWRSIRSWWQDLREWRWEVTLSPTAMAPLLGWLLLSYLAFNFLTVIRPFPIGWDDLGVYLNKPRLLVSYGKLIPQMGSFQWEYLTSLGFLLFGYDSTFGATAAMIINWSAGALAVAALYAFGRAFLPAGALLAALLYYTLPLVGHFSFADMKIDNAVFAAGVGGTLCLFLYLFPQKEEPESNGDHRWHLPALCGIFLGFAFGMKVTAVMIFMALGAIVIGARLGGWGFAGAALLGSTALVYKSLNVTDLLSHLGLPPDALSRLLPSLTNILSQMGMSQSSISKFLLACLFLLIGGGSLAFSAFRFRKRLRPLATEVAIVLAAFFVSMLPWLVYNSVAANQYFHLVLSPPNTLSPTVDVSHVPVPTAKPPILGLPKEIALDISKCQSTAKTEELDRYWGFGSGWSHYATLPWRTVMNLDSAGYYVTTMPALLLFPLLLLLPLFWLPAGRWLRWLWMGTAFIIVQWMFLANGIPWYGLSMFHGLVFALAALATASPSRWHRGVAGLLLAISVLFALAHREWQFGNMLNLYEYPIGKVSAESMRERTIPHYDNVRDIVLQRAEQMPDRPYVFRAGTFIPYFIPRNLELIPIADNQLELFKCLYQERDAQLTLKRLQALGYNSIIFDTNTQTIERDPNGTLHQKVNLFLEFVNTPNLGIRVVVNDPDNGIAFLLLP